MEQEKLDEIFKKHELWLQNKSSGERADLKGADLKGAALDYSCIPLWCGSLDVHFDDRQLYQIAYHLVRAGLYSKNVSDETKDELSKLIGFANKFHRVEECGKIIANLTEEKRDESEPKESPSGLRKDPTGNGR